jgi:hypothetical protein
LSTAAPVAIKVLPRHASILPDVLFLFISMRIVDADLNWQMEELPVIENVILERMAP